MESFQRIYTQLIDAGETTRIEAKRASELGDAVMKTICAFANEPGLGGGYILLGVSSRTTHGGPEYTVTGVSSLDEVQQELANQCRNSFSSVIRPEIAVSTEFGDKRVLTVHIPEADANDKPIYIKKPGIHKGAYRRIGSTDQLCTDGDIALFFQSRTDDSYDRGIVPRADMNDIDRSSLTEYRRVRAKINPVAEELNLKNTDLVVSIGAATLNGDSVKVTRAGLLLFGKKTSLRRLMPAARVDYILVPGREWVPEDAARYRSVEIREPLITAVPRIVDLVSQDLPKTFKLKSGGTRRKEIPIVPFIVVREAIVNAVMHRNYRAHQPIQIIKFSNRLEIRNSGHSLVADDRLGEPGSQTRNPCLAAILHETGYAETKGTGIRVMRQQMRRANLTTPVFASSRENDSFEVRLLTHHLLDPESVDWLGRLQAADLTEHDAKALVIAHQQGHIDNATFRAVNDVDTLTASNALRRLVEARLLLKHGRSTATFYTLTPEAERARGQTPYPIHKTALSQGFKGAVASQAPSPEVVALLRKVGDRSAEQHLVELAILKLCAPAPMTAPELARYLSRSAQYLTRRYIRRLVVTGKLQYLYPSQQSHPRQAYRTTPSLLLDLEVPAAKPRQRPKATHEPAAVKLPFDREPE